MSAIKFAADPAFWEQVIHEDDLNLPVVDVVHPVDAWIDALGVAIENPYDPCPCGCGIKFRFVVKKGHQYLYEHEEQFIRNYRMENPI